MKKVVKSIAAVTGVAALAGVGAYVAGRVLTHKSSEASEDEKVRHLIGDDSALAVGVVRAQALLSLICEGKENALYSPAALEVVLSLLSEGSSEKALGELLSYTDLMMASDAHEYLHSLRGMQIDSTMWYDIGMQPEPELMEVSEWAYDAEVLSLDFNNPATALERINTWFKLKSPSVVPDVVTDAGMASSLVLGSSMLYGAKWEKPLRSSQGIFVSGNGAVVEVENMLHGRADSYMECKGARAFGKMYDNDCMFVGILPSDGVDIGDIDLVELLKSEIHSENVFITMPAFSMDFSCADIKSHLQILGMQHIFAPEAKSSFLQGENAVGAVACIAQSCHIDVTGESTSFLNLESTKNMFGGNFESPRFSLTLNRPFYYMIVDTLNERVVCIGVVDSVGGKVLG